MFKYSMFLERTPKTCESNANENVEKGVQNGPFRHNRALGPKIGPKWPYSKGMAKGHAFLMHEQAHAEGQQGYSLAKGLK